MIVFFSGGAEAGAGDSADGSGWGRAIGQIGWQSSPQDHLSTHTGGAQLHAHPKSSSGLHLWRYGLLRVPRGLQWVFDQETYCFVIILVDTEKWAGKNGVRICGITGSSLQNPSVLADVFVLFSSLPGSGGVRWPRREQYRWRYSGPEKGVEFGPQLCCWLRHQPQVLLALLRQHVSPQQTGPLTSTLPAGQPQPPQGLSALTTLWIQGLHEIFTIYSGLICWLYKMWSWLF